MIWRMEDLSTWTMTNWISTLKSSTKKGANGCPENGNWHQDERFRLTSETKDDLRAIRRYIAKDNPIAASRVLVEIKSAIRFLADNPGAGHTREDLASPNLRFWSV